MSIPTERAGIFVGGAYVSSTGSDRIEVVSPHSEAVVGWVPSGTNADMDKAVEAASRALASTEWGRTTPLERSKLLRSMADHLRAVEVDAANLVTTENGSPIKLSLPSQIRTATGVFDYYADLVAEYSFEEGRTGRIGNSIVRQVPVGVVAAITPWNYPLYLAATKIAPAIAAGATVVLKPAPETPLSAYLFSDAALAAGLPAGVLNVVPAERAVSAYLVSHPEVDKVAFTGSTATGAMVAAACADRIARVSLELGGKSAAVILDDADINTVLPGILAAGLRNSGQVCIAQTRILAPAGRYQEVLEGTTELARSTRVGDPFAPETDLGPVISARQRSSIESYVESARSEGGQITTGGKRPSMDSGWYVQPTIIGHVSSRMTVFQKEIFGPVICVVPYRDENDAIDLANNSAYGLAGTVWTGDEDRGVGFARQIRAGTVGVNGIRLDPAIPFGGFKKSGYGRELGPEGLAAYLEQHTIHLPLPAVRAEH